MLRLFFILFVSLIIISCADAKVYDVYKPIVKNQWHKDSIVQFDFEPIDTVSKNNIYINLRNNKNYDYSNLFLIVGIDFPDNRQFIDTLEYEMTDAEGRFLGKGFTDIKENKLEYKTNVTFLNSGIYHFSVQHAMRKSGEIDGLTYLDGITDVGLEIEKIKTDGQK